MDSVKFKNMVKKALEKRDFDTWSADGLGYLSRFWVDMNYGLGSSLPLDFAFVQANDLIEEAKTEVSRA